MSGIKLEYSRGTVLAGLFTGLVLGCLLGLELGARWMKDNHPLQLEHNQVKEQCEKDLPRSQECVVEMVGKVVEDKLSR